MRLKCQLQYNTISWSNYAVLSVVGWTNKVSAANIARICPDSVHANGSIVQMRQQTRPVQLCRFHASCTRTGESDGGVSMPYGGFMSAPDPSAARSQCQLPAAGVDRQDGVRLVRRVWCACHASTCLARCCINLYARECGYFDPQLGLVAG
jgi:hypothetical protein